MATSDMNITKWILLIPVCLIAYFLAIFSIAFLYSLIPSLRENPFLDYFIMPSLINIIAIFIYFSIGGVIAGSENVSINKVLAVIILIVQLFFLIATITDKEYSKVISSAIGVAIGIIALIDSFKKK